MDTYFPDTARHVGRLLREARLDREALSQPIRRCQLAACRGTCCHDGVYLNPDEASGVSRLARDHREFFDGIGLDLPEKPVVYGNSNGVSGLKTATRPAPMSSLAEDYPSHFADTQCVFQTGEARCGLQLLASELGEHPWRYKPFTCWMHPLSISDGALTLHNRENDPQNLPGYPGFSSQTHCGRMDACGEPAHVVLAEELEVLGKVAGRDIAHELEAPQDLEKRA